MRLPSLLVLATLLCAAGPATAQEFSLYGVRLGMTRAEVKAVWQPLEGGEFHVRESALFQVKGDFDHQDRLYRVHFSMPVPETFPFELGATAYQNLVNERWGSNRDLQLGLRTGRGSVDATVTSKRLLDEYTQFIARELSAVLRP